MFIFANRWDILGKAVSFRDYADNEEHSQGQFAADYATWQAQQSARAVELKSLLTEAAASPELLRQAIEEAEQQLPTLYLAKPTSEPILTHRPLPAAPESYTLIAADGSQIAPSRHRALQFGVVNVGLIKARIGSGETPQIWVETELLTPQQIQTSEGNLISEDEIALLRDLAERKRIRQAVSSEDAGPVITLTDGPLDIFTAQPSRASGNARCSGIFLTTKTSGAEAS